MKPKLPDIVQRYVDASNAHDSSAIASCFSDIAIVQDERNTHHGKESIERWAAETINKYKFQFKPVGINGEDSDIVASIEVSGTFDGSPVTLEYRFRIENGLISSLAIS